MSRGIPVRVASSLSSVVVGSLPGYGQTDGHTLDREKEDEDENDVEISDLPRRDMLCCAAFLRDMM
jgi:hypothetical protein